MNARSEGPHIRRRPRRLILPLVLGVVLMLSLFAGVAQAEDGYKFGLDAHQPFSDPEAQALHQVPPGMKIITAYIAVGNRLPQPLPFRLEDLVLGDENGRPYRKHVTPIWVPPLSDGDLGADEVVGGYVSWLVPFSVWPVTVSYTPPDAWGHGLGQGWLMGVFADVRAGDRYFRQIGQLKYRGAVGGYGDGTFRPNSPILRAQFAKILMHAASADGTADFSYPTGYLEAAESRGFLTGGPDDGMDRLTRLEAARAVALLGADLLSPPPADYRLPFTDVPQSARDAVALLVFNKIIDGTGSRTFSPWATLSRGQSAKMVARLLDPVPPENAPVLDSSTR